MKKNSVAFALILAMGVVMASSTTPVYSAPTESQATQVELDVQARGFTGAELAGTVAGGAVGGAVAGGLGTALIGTPAATVGALAGGVAGAAGGLVGNVVQQLFPFANTQSRTAQYPANALD